MICEEMCLRGTFIQQSKDIEKFGHSSHYDIILTNISLTVHLDTCPQHCSLLLQLLLSVKTGKTKVNSEQGTLFRNTEGYHVMWYINQIYSY